MPYERNADLPAAVRRSLPSEAQTIYRKAFNNAWDQYRERRKRRGAASREETAHKVAWAAVKSSFRRSGERWVRIG